MDANAFAATLTAFADQVSAAIEPGAEQLAGQIRDRAAARTPVKTGRARAGWVVVPGPDGPRVENEVPYIGELEDGTAHHTGHHMLAIAIEEASR